MGVVQRFSTTVGDALPVNEISDWLGVEATTIGRKGEPISGRPRNAVYRNNFWLWRAYDDRKLSFETQILPILDLLESKPQVWQRIKAISGIEILLRFGFSSSHEQGGCSIASPTLSRIGALGLDIDLDLYPPGDRKEA